MKGVVPEVFEATREAEMALLGAILIMASIEDVPKLEVSPEDFLDYGLYDNKHTRIYQAMLKCQRPHQINVARELNRQNKLKKYDCAYLSRLVATCPFPLDYLEYANAVKEYSNKRQGKKTFEGIPL